MYFYIMHIYWVLRMFGVDMESLHAQLDKMGTAIPKFSLAIADEWMYKQCTNPHVIFFSLALICASLMLWHPAEIFFPDSVNLFLTKKNTYAQPAKWYVFFTQGFVEIAWVNTLLYYNLRRLIVNLHFMVPFLVYNVWRIFEYWLFAFSIDRYLVILTVLFLSSWLYGKHKPRKRVN